MPPKGKRAAPKEETAAKKSKTEEKKKEEPKKEEPKKEEPKKEEPKKEEKPAEEQPAEEAGEKEQDDKKDTRPSIKENKIVFDNAETTLNVVPTTGGKVLMALTDGGMQFLIAGARANVGLKAGRYFYEVKVIEALTPMEGAHQGKARLPLPRQLVRLGVSTAGSSLILGDTEDCVCFDSDGFFFAEKKKTAVSQRFSRDMVIGVLLNLDPKSPNANTISLFRNGERVSKPQPLPEKLKGQPLFPHVSFRNVSVQVNFGPTPLASLPFKCRMLQEAATADVKEVKPTVPKDGKYDVLFPVAFPDEGTFDWLDGFLEKNPQYVEISDRKIQDWAIKSGAWKPKSQNWKTSNDKPEFNFGIQHLDDFSVRRAINSIAPIVPRHYVVMEVKQNLTAADRAVQLKKFSAPHFKKIAHVVMGEPKADYKKKVHAQLLAEKQQKAEAAWKVRKLDKDRKKALALKQKQIAEAQKAAKEAKEAAAKEAAAKKAAEEKKEDGEKKEEGDKKEEEKKEDDKPEEKEAEKKEEEKKEEEKKEEEKKEEEEEEDEPMPTAELTEEEKKLNFRPPVITDLTAQVLNASFANFTIPEKSEGFDAVNYEWQTESKAKEYLKKWVLDKKLTSRIEDIQPSEWFTTFAAGYQKSYQEWQAKQKEFQATKKKDEAKEGKKEGDADKKEDDDDDEEAKKMEVDIFSIEDVCDMGNGEPLFAKFAFEDWALMTLRYELHVLQAAFKKDANDPDRVGIPEGHLAFYYTRYFKKQFNPKCYGKETVEQVVDLVKDTVKIDPDSKTLASVVAEEPEGAAAYVKMQEESRRKRQQRIDAGDETARLDFSVLQQQQQRDQRPAKGGAKGDAAAAGAVAAVPGSAPRMVPAPRSQGWQNQQARAPAWQGGKSGGKSGGKWQPQQQQQPQQQYAPRLGKVGKK